MDDRLFFPDTSHRSLPPETPNPPLALDGFANSVGSTARHHPDRSPNSNPPTSKLIDAAGVAEGGGLSQIKRTDLQAIRAAKRVRQKLSYI